MENQEINVELKIVDGKWGVGSINKREAWNGNEIFLDALVNINREIPKQRRFFTKEQRSVYAKKENYKFKKRQY